MYLVVFEDGFVEKFEEISEEMFLDYADRGTFSIIDIGLEKSPKLYYGNGMWEDI